MTERAWIDPGAAYLRRDEQDCGPTSDDLAELALPDGYENYSRSIADLHKPVWTYRLAARALTPAEDAAVRRAAERDPRAVRYRRARDAADGPRQVALFG
jgi:hypothetical protein